MEHIGNGYVRRIPIIAGSMGAVIGSTTGVPEGDVWSVLAMLATSALFYFRNASPHLSPFTYADNWSWISKSISENFKAWIRTLNLTASLRMIISISKS